MSDASSPPEGSTTATPPPAPAPAKRSPLRRLLRRLGWLCLAAVALIAALPTLIARTGLRHQLPALARPGLPDGVTIGEATLGWFSPVVCRQVRIPDLTGRELLTIAEIRTDRPLWELASAPEDVGRITIQGLAVDVVVRPDGTNLQDVLARLQSTPARRSRPRLRLEVHAGTLRAVDEQGAPIFGCESIEALFDDLRHDGTAVLANLNADTVVPSTQGRLAFNGAWTPPAAAEEVIGPGTIELSFTDWPLDPLSPLLRGPLDAAAFAGQASLKVDARWSRLSTAGGEAELTLSVPRLEAAIQPAVSQQPLKTIQEQNLHCRLHGTYSGASDRLDLSDSTFRTPWFDGSARGFLSDLRGQLLCDLTGDVVLKLDAVRERLPPAVQAEVRLEGVETRRVSLRGPLRPAAGAVPTPLAVEADVVWRLLEAYGVSSPDAELRVAWLGQRLATDPVKVPVSGGRVAAVPQVEFAEAGPVLHFAGGPVLEQVAFSEAMCRSWMRYLSPLMANTTSINGTFTLAIAPTTLPLEAGPPADLQGTLSIHSARVGPGPVTQQILGLVQQIRGVAERRPAGAAGDAATWLDITNQDVPFAVRNGRVEHRNLRLSVGPVQIESQGSVGVADDSLDLVLLVRFPDSWFENRPLLAHLKDEGLRIPIRGTLGQPQVDARPLGEFGRGIGVRAVDGLLRKLLDREP